MELYPRFFEFSVDEFEINIFIFYFNGINRSPRLSHKLKKNREDNFQGNHLLVTVFSTYDARRLK